MKQLKAAREGCFFYAQRQQAELCFRIGYKLFRRIFFCRSSVIKIECMRYALLLFLLLPGSVQAQRFSTADLRMLKTYASGWFQTMVNDKVPAGAALHLQPIWPKRKDGVWTFAVRSDSGRIPVYQVWHFYQQDDTTLLLQLLDFKDSAKGAELAADINKQSALAFFHLAPLRGCEIYLAKSKNGYTGTSSGQECFVSQPGVEYLSLSLSLTAGGIEWTQKAFDKDGQPANYPGNGTWHYRKQKTH